MDWRKQGQYYRTAILRHGGREVSVTVSPQGKSTRVFVDGEEIK